RAQLRALAAAEQLYDEVAKPAARPDGPDKAEPAQVPPAADPAAPAALKGATQAVVEAKKQQEAAKTRLKQAQARKDALSRGATDLEAAPSPVTASLKALDDLKPFAVEIGLRLKDGTLGEAAAPAHLQPAALEKTRAEVAAEPARLRKKVGEATAAQAEVGKQLQEADKGVLAADADLAQASTKLAREQKRQEVEKTYSGKGPDERRADAHK